MQTWSTESQNCWEPVQTEMGSFKHDANRQTLELQLCKMKDYEKEEGYELEGTSTALSSRRSLPQHQGRHMATQSQSFDSLYAFEARIIQYWSKQNREDEIYYLCPTITNGPDRPRIPITINDYGPWDYRGPDSWAIFIRSLNSILICDTRIHSRVIVWHLRRINAAHKRPSR
jgi:hypothetical protein